MGVTLLNDDDQRISKELLPCPLPFPGVGAFDHAAVKSCSRSVRSRLRSRLANQEWANSAVQTLNEVYGHSSPAPPRASAGQEAALQRIRATFEEVPKAECMDSAAAFNVLCGGLAGYDSPSASQATRAKYRRDSVSLPPKGCAHAKPCEILTGEALEAWCDWREVLLRSPAERDEAIQRDGNVDPFTDPALLKKPSEYAYFLSTLAERGVVNFGRYKAASVGIFFVPRKDGQLRLIFDTRQANQRFRAPYHTPLPTAGAFCSTELDAEASLHVRECDVQCAFYRLECPDGMQEYFTLPATTGRQLRAQGVEPGMHLRDDDLVTPRLAVLAMGFSWSLFFCPKAIEQVVQRCGFSEEQFVVDRAPPPDLSGGKVGVAVYVDGVASLGSDLDAVDDANQRIRQGLAEANLECSAEVDEPTGEQTFVGLDFDRDRGQISVKAKRIWNLRLALVHALGLGKLTSQQLRQLLGHLTWAGLARRGFLSLFSSVYKFIEAGHVTPRPIWDSVAKELWWATTLLPLLHADLRREWSPTVYATASAGACSPRRSPRRWGGSLSGGVTT